MALEFAVDDRDGKEHIYTKFSEALHAACKQSLARGGEAVNVDVLAWSEADARRWAGDDGVESYREDPDASVFDRIVVKAESRGRIA